MKISRIPMGRILLALVLGAQSALAFYNPQTGRWLSRDPVEETVWFDSVQKFSRIGLMPVVFTMPNTRNLYHFVFNSSVNSTDRLGLEPTDGEPCCVEPCEISATFQNIKVTPIYPPTGGTIAIDWIINTKVNYTAKGGCVILGCEYWTCNKNLHKDAPNAWTGGSCNSWRYKVGGPIGAPWNWHAKAMDGRINYMSCENGKWKTMPPLSGGMLHYGFTYNPPTAQGAGTYP